MAAAGWAVLAVTWLVVTLIVPAASDNRPRLESILIPEDASEEVHVG
jgi:hypothetical protein